ncbi:MAG TPA: pyridoxamine 5'-phosphate oxidase family protein [Syntrophorhabdaceae bacterium]|nr:pyridoxamine 5'-phosphate oxidase family protein [Syntrophorhabdaceae bacterium]
MTKEEVISFVRSNPVCFLATVEGNAPRVRGMQMFKADERGILIQLATVKDMYKQLVANPNVELCFNDFKSGIQVRVSGKAEFLEGPGVAEEVLTARPFLKSVADAHGQAAIKVFRIANAQATVWTRETNLAPKTYIKL